MRLQPGRQESIDKLWDMVKERLIDWAENHGGRLPKNILFYRDGVSESQYDGVRTKEIPQLHRAVRLACAYLCGDWDEYYGDVMDRDDETRPESDDASCGRSSGKEQFRAYQKACDDRDATSTQTKAQQTSDTAKAAEMEDDSKRALPETTKALQKLREAQTETGIRITYVVVDKRHNTRFYPTNRSETFTGYGGGNGNVQPGLCVDQVITHPYSFDFFLQSHKPIQGTGRAAHYFVLTNKMGLSPDQLQAITHAFCYTYVKATRVVSYCTPAYYADRLCDRGRA